MTKPKEETIEELTAEIAANERKIQQYENRKKIIARQKDALAIYGRRSAY